jgi:hypothetical protein
MVVETELQELPQLQILVVAEVVVACLVTEIQVEQVALVSLLYITQVNKEIK